MLRYYLIDDKVPVFKTTIQAENLMKRGHNVKEITPIEFNKYFNEYAKSFEYVS
jgi:hypothetical protein